MSLGPRQLVARCPACGGEARRSRRTPADRLRFWATPWRCRACGLRFRRVSGWVGPAAAALLALGLAAAAFTAARLLDAGVARVEP